MSHYLLDYILFYMCFTTYWLMFLTTDHVYFKYYVNNNDWSNDDKNNDNNNDKNNDNDDNRLIIMT